MLSPSYDYAGQLSEMDLKRVFRDNLAAGYMFVKLEGSPEMSSVAVTVCVLPRVVGHRGARALL